MNFLEPLESRRMMSATPTIDAPTSDAHPATTLTAESLSHMQVGVDHAGRICLTAKGEKTLYLNLDGSIGKWNPNAEPYDEFTRAAYIDCVAALQNGATVTAEGASVYIQGTYYSIEITPTRWCWHSMH